MITQEKGRIRDGVSMIGGPNFPGWLITCGIPVLFDSGVTVMGPLYFTDIQEELGDPNRLQYNFITHAHFDHIAGIDDLRIFTLRSNHPIDVFGNDISVEDIKQRYNYFFNPPQIGGGILSLTLHVIDSECHYNGVTVTPIPVKHGILDIIGYRFDDFGYITDASYVSEESINLLKGIKILVINALRQRPHETHFSIGQAIEVADAIAPEQTYFTHICHHLEHVETNTSLPTRFQLGYDGLEIML